LDKFDQEYSKAKLIKQMEVELDKLIVEERNIGNEHHNWKQKEEIA